MAIGEPVAVAVQVLFFDFDFDFEPDFELCFDFEVCFVAALLLDFEPDFEVCLAVAVALLRFFEELAADFLFDFEPRLLVVWLLAVDLCRALELDFAVARVSCLRPPLSLTPAPVAKALPLDLEPLSRKTIHYRNGSYTLRKLHRCLSPCCQHEMRCSASFLHRL